MYGLVNQGIKDLVIGKFGEGTWNELCDSIQCPRDFVSMQYYEDTITYQLVGAVSEKLSIPAAQVLNTYGQHWVKYTAQEGYGPIMDLFGKDFKTCLKNLNHLHTRMGMTLPQLRPPSFTFKELDETLCHLEYTSERQGLAPMVQGLIQGLAEKYKIKVEIREVGSNPPVTTFEIRILESI